MSSHVKVEVKSSAVLLICLSESTIMTTQWLTGDSGQLDGDGSAITFDVECFAYRHDSLHVEYDRRIVGTFVSSLYCRLVGLLGYFRRISVQRLHAHY